MRSFQLDAGVQRLIDGLEPGSLEVGLLLGRLGAGQRDLVYKLLLLQGKPDEPPLCSLTEAKATPGKKGGRPAGVAVAIETEAVVERALQIAAMLTGGVDIVGVALVAPTSAAAAALPQLARIADEVTADRGQAEAPWLLLTADPASHKLAGKEHVAQAKPAGQPKPCELKCLDLAGQLRLLTCRHAIDIDACLPAGSSRSVGEALSREAAAEAARVAAALCTAGGRLLSGAAPVADLAAGGQQAQLSLLCRPACERAAPVNAAEAGAEACGRLRVRGCIAGAALAHAREPAAAAAELLKADVARSLQARVDVLLAEAEEAGEGSLLSQLPGQAAAALILPRRALFPVEAWLPASEYVLAGEGAEHVAAAALEALQLRLDPAAVQWPEDGAAPGAQKAGRWRGNETASIEAGLGEGRPPIPFGFRTGQQVVWVSTVICVLSCLVSYALITGIWPRR